MKRSLRAMVFASLLAVMIFAVPVLAHAAPIAITQSPDTTGMTYEAGSWQSVSWACSEVIPEDASIVLYRAEPLGITDLLSVPVESGLGPNGGTEVQIPSEGGPYFYYVEAEWTDEYGGEQDAQSEAYISWLYGSPWWFTIGTAPTILQQPVDQEAYVGGTATFTTSVDGSPMPDVQWQLDDGSGWADISGATSEMYETPEMTAEMDGWQYRAYVSNAVGSIYTDEVGLYLAGPTITQTPDTTGMTYAAGSELLISWTSQGVPEGTTVELDRANSWSPTGLDSTTIQTGLPISGSTTVTIPAEDGQYFYFLRAEWPVEGGAEVAYSDAFHAQQAGAPWAFTAGHAPTVWDSPMDQTVTLGQTASFAIAGQGYPTPTIQWQVNDGTGWADITGATTASYTTPATTAGMDGLRYRALLSNVLGTATTDDALLTVTLTPTITQQPQPQTAAQGVSATFEASAVGDPAPDVQWQVNDGSGWSDIPGATSGSYTTPVTTAGMHGWQYRAVFNNSRGTATSDAVALTVIRSVAISAPSVNPAIPKTKRQATFSATVSPAAAASDVTFTLHLLHWETRRVNGVRVEGWYEYPSVSLAVSDAAAGTVSGTAALPKRGEWKMYVTSTAASAWEAGQSSETPFTVK